MKNKITIAIDAMGGDNSPAKTIEGLKFFLDNNKSKKDFYIKLYDDEKKITIKIDINKRYRILIKIFFLNFILN